MVDLPALPQAAHMDAMAGIAQMTAPSDWMLANLCAPFSCFNFLSRNEQPCSLTIINIPWTGAALKKKKKRKKNAAWKYNTYDLRCH